MSMIFELLQIFEKMGITIETPEINVNLKDPSKLQQIIYARLLKNQISMVEFKSKINQLYFEEKEFIAERCVDEFLKSLFDQLGINLSDEILYPFRSAIIKDTMIKQHLAYSEQMEAIFNIMEFFTGASFLNFMDITWPNLIISTYKKYFMPPSNPSIDGRNRLMELFCFTILGKIQEKGMELKKK